MGRHETFENAEPLLPLAFEREHRIDAATLATNINVNLGLANADEFTLPPAEATSAGKPAEQKGEVTIALPKPIPADGIDWNSPPPGFMAYPAINPTGWLNIREGLKLECERLRDIAEAEFERKVEGYQDWSDADESVLQPG